MFFHYFCKNDAPDLSGRGASKTTTMEFKQVLSKRRSIRKFTERAVPREVVDRLLAETLTAPSARNTRTTRLLVVDDPQTVARMATKPQIIFPVKSSLKE